ncbi:MAG TPA: LLM class flavin-dependent oxidoreductase, partial [Acidimicrobiia bacterium]
HRAYGLEFPPAPTRYAMLEDTLEMLPLLWGKGSPSFAGQTFSARELICYPRPVQEHIPILVGGSGERRTLRLVAERADACNLFGTPETVRRKVDALWRHCETIGRDRATVEVSHLVTVLTAEDRKALRARVDSLRGRNTTPESYSERNNAGTVEDHIGLFSSYARSGVNHSIVALPDVAMEGSIESFGRVIQALGRA